MVGSSVIVCRKLGKGGREGRRRREEHSLPHPPIGRGRSRGSLRFFPRLRVRSDFMRHECLAYYARRNSSERERWREKEEIERKDRNDVRWQSVTHSIGEDEGREGAAVWPGRLNRELVSRWILIMSPREMRREEGERRARSNREFESGARSRNLTELGAVANPTRRPAASSHFFTPLHYYPVTNPLMPPSPPTR